MTTAPSLWVILLLMVVAVGLLIHYAAPPGRVQIQGTRIIMGTQVDVTVRAKERTHAERGILACFKEMERIQTLMNVHHPDSEISQVNRLAGGNWVVPHPELFQLVQQSMELSRLSNGAFDITVGPLVALWRGKKRSGEIPSRDEIRRALTRVGYERVLLDPRGRRIHFTGRGMSLDLGGIAKGYALDKAAEVLRREGIEEALLNAGGDILALEGKGKSSWSIGIRHPRDLQGILASLEIRDMAIATSGDYERYFMHDGKRYHHILNPRTGYPSTGCRSVTVVFQNATQADALATAAFVMGPEKGLAFLEQKTGVEGIIVDDRGGQFVTSGLDGKVKWKR